MRRRLGPDAYCVKIHLMNLSLPFLENGWPDKWSDHLLTWSYQLLWSPIQLDNWFIFDILIYTYVHACMHVHTHSLYTTAYYITVNSQPWECTQGSCTSNILKWHWGGRFQISRICQWVLLDSTKLLNALVCLCLPIMLNWVAHRAVLIVHDVPHCHRDIWYTGHVSDTDRGHSLKYTIM